MEDDNKFEGVWVHNMNLHYERFLKKYENDLNKQTSAMKSLSNCWGEIIDKLMENGTHHFGITINLPQNDIYLVEEYLWWSDHKGKFDYDKPVNSHKIEFSGVREMSDDESIGPDIGENGNIRDLKCTNCLSRDNIIGSIDESLYINQLYKTVLFAVVELGENKKHHLHILLGIKNMIDYNHVLKLNLQKYILTQLKNDYKELDWDIRVDSLEKFKDIKNWVMYMHKEIKTWTNTSLLILDQFIFENNPTNSKLEMELLNIYRNSIIPYNSCNCYSFGAVNKDFEKIKGIKLKNNEINQNTLINILQYYLILNNMYIYNNNIYKKVENTLISYELIGTITEVLYNKFQEDIVLYYVTHFSGYFDGFDFNYLLNTHFIKSKNIIESIKDIITNKIEPDFSLMEFSDGIYSLKHDRFILLKDIEGKNLNVATIKYYNKSYQRVRKNKPTNWINGLKNALNIKNKNNVEKNKDFIKIYNAIANIFQELNNKKSTLFIWGVSNSGKTTLIVNPIINYHGNDNVGSVISGKNFKWQELIGKKVCIIDEGRYNSSMSSDLLKITGKENIIVEKKYSKEHIEIEPLPIFIVSNILFKDENEDVNKAMFNRMDVVEFINAISNDILSGKDNFKKILKEEEANIIIYCNKLYFKNNKIKTKYKLNKEILNTILLEDSGGGKKIE